MKAKPVDALLKAKNYSFLLLKFRPRSEGELTLRLKRKKFDEKVIRATIAFLKEKRFLNDNEFARAWIDYRLKKPLGFRLIQQELRRKGVDKKIIEEQLLSALEGLTAAQVSGLVVAYEPIWAIGTGKAASPDDAEEAASMILRLISDHYKSEKRAGPIIQYGGSVKADNIDAYITLPSVSGALVGGASLEAESFSALIQAARKAVLH